MSTSLAVQATADLDFPPVTRPTMYFVGVTTGKSSIMSVFPRWTEHLGLGDVQICGIDCRWHDAPAVYRRVVEHIRSDPLVRGALVTTHKLDLLRACRDLFDELDPWAELLGEISSISKRGDRLVGHAKDPITSGLSLQAFVPDDHWAKTGGQACILGAGGSSLALSCWMIRHYPSHQRPARLVVTNRSPGRLDEMRYIHRQMGNPIPTEYVLAPDAAGNDAVVAALPPCSLVVNATGLGKDAPGSPLTDAACFPQHGLAWEFNYRGDLLFLRQARDQAADRGLHVEDGWVYFIHGWTRVIAEVFNITIPTAGPAFDELSRIAAGARR